MIWHSDVKLKSSSSSSAVCIVSQLWFRNDRLGPYGWICTFFLYCCSWSLMSIIFWIKEWISDWFDWRRFWAVTTFTLITYHCLIPFTPDFKLISFTNRFLHSHSYSFRTDFTDLNLYCIKRALALFVLVSFLATCARLSCILSFRVHVKLAYRIVSYRIVS